MPEHKYQLAGEPCRSERFRRLQRAGCQGAQAARWDCLGRSDRSKRARLHRNLCNLTQLIYWSSISFRMNNSIQSLVTKLLTEGGKVVGVEYDQGTSAFTSAEKKSQICCAGGGTFDLSMSCIFLSNLSTSRAWQPSIAASVSLFRFSGCLRVEVNRLSTHALLKMHLDRRRIFEDELKM